MSETYLFSPVEFAAAFSQIRPRCQCRVCVGVRGWAASLGGGYDPGDRAVRDDACIRMPRILENKARRAQAQRSATASQTGEP